MLYLLLLIFLIYVILMTKIEILLMIIGIGFALFVSGAWLYCIVTEGYEKPKMGVPAKILSFVLRLAVAMLLYVFLCQNGLIPEQLIVLPEFLRTLLLG